MQQFFSQNQTIVVFAHGLVFFSLGLAVWLQRRRASRLVLTNALIWLAAFATAEAFATWGNVFIPIQQSYMDATLISGLQILQGLLEAATYVLMVQFGLRLLELDRGLRRWLTAASIGIWGLIIGAGIVVGHAQHWTAIEWEHSVDNVAALCLLVTGCVLAAIGMWRQRGALSAAGMRGIRPYAVATAAVLVFYALISAVIVIGAPWAPGVITQAHWLSLTGIPVDVVQGLAGLVLCVLAAKLLEIFEFEAKQRVDALERSRAIAEERARFGRDLHDGTIQSIYAAALRLEAIALRSDDDPMCAEVRGVVGDLNHVTDDIRSYITDLAQTPDTASGIADRLRELGAEFDAESQLRVRVHVAGIAASGPIPQGAGKHLKQIVREALSNAARHAGRCSVDVRLAFATDEIELVVSDNGRGIVHDDDPSAGLGLRNMHERARRMGGRLEVTSLSPGTRITVSIPLDSDLPDSTPIPQYSSAKVMP